MKPKQRIHSALRAMFLFALLGINAQALATSSVFLGSAGSFTILAKTGVSTVGTTSVVGNIGISPAAASYITGFGLIADSSNKFSTSSLVNGRIYAADYAPPTPSLMSVAIGDMQIAYTDAAGRAPGTTELAAGSIGGLVLAPGVYYWSSGVNIATDLTLSGNANAVWIFQIAQTLNISSGKKILLAGGAKAENIFWQVAGQTTLGTNSVFNGTILDQTLIAINTGATLNGKALAQTAVTLQAASVVSDTSGYFGPNAPSKGQTFAFPSPAGGDKVTMVYQMAESGKSVVQVYNENGDLAATVESQNQAGDQKTDLAIGDFAPGVYMYRVVMTYDSGVTERSSLEKFSVIK